MGRFAIVAGNRPVKRKAPAPLDEDPLVRARVRYVTSSLSLRDVAAEFRGQPGCSPANLFKVAAENGWLEEKEQSRSKVVADSVSALEADEVRRNVEHLRMTRNTLNTIEGILSGLHEAVRTVLEDQAAQRITRTYAIAALDSLAKAAKNVMQAQGFGITLEQTLGSTEASGFQRFADAAEAKYQEVVARRNELVKRAEDAAAELAKDKRKGRAAK